MRGMLKRLRHEDDGAVTVDWVVLTAAMTAMGVAIVLGVRESATEPAAAVGNRLTSYNIE